MTEIQYTRGLSFLGHLQHYTSNGCSLAEAKQRLLRRINAGEFVVDKHLTLTPPVLHLELAARDRLFFVTAAERVDVSDVFTLEPVREPPSFGPPVPMSDALIERLKAKLREPGLMYVVSSRGVETPADILDRFDKAEPAPVESVPAAPDDSVSNEPTESMTAKQLRVKIETWTTSWLNDKPDLEHVDRDHYMAEAKAAAKTHFKEKLSAAEYCRAVKAAKTQSGDILSTEGYHRALQATKRIKFGPKLPPIHRRK